LKTMFISIIIVMILLFAIPFCLILYLRVKKRDARRKNRSPFNDNFLRSPGESLRKEIEQLNHEISTYFDIIIIMPLISYSIYISQLYFGLVRESYLLYVYVIVPLIFIAYCIKRFFEYYNKRKKLRLGYDGEVAVGQELNQLMRNGYYVYHDFPANGFNIDHIVIGPAGVFAVETKGRRKSLTGNAKAEARVVYDGESLKFPKWTETRPLEQAKNQAEWLARFLAKAVGDHVEVMPVLFLPGWFVERISKNGIPVLSNLKGFNFLLKNNVLSENMIKRIAHQVEQKCRDTEPMISVEFRA